MNYYDKCFRARGTGTKWVIDGIDTGLTAVHYSPGNPPTWFISTSFTLQVKPKDGTRTDDELESACDLDKNKRFINYVKRILMDHIMYGPRREMKITKIYFPTHASFNMSKITIPRGRELPSGLYTSIGDAKGEMLVKAT